MSITTTHEIKRELALEAIYSKLESATNRELESVLENLVNNEFYNFSIVEEFEEPNEYDGIFYHSPRIESLNDLPDEKYNQYYANS